MSGESNGWRYIVGRPVKHYVRSFANGPVSPTSDCGKRPGPGDRWRGDATASERAKLATLRECRMCVLAGARPE